MNDTLKVDSYGKRYYKKGTFYKKRNSYKKFNITNSLKFRCKYELKESNINDLDHLDKFFRSSLSLMSPSLMIFTGFAILGQLYGKETLLSQVSAFSISLFLSIVLFFLHSDYKKTKRKMKSNFMIFIVSLLAFVFSLILILTIGLAGFNAVNSTSFLYNDELKQSQPAS